jgi:DNA-binding LytR/AlgR family response regulator
MHIADENTGPRVSTTPDGGELPSSRPRRIVGRRGHRLVFLDIDEVWAVEAQDRLTFVHAVWGRFDLDVSLAAIQLSFARDLVRVHRNWLVNLAWVKELESRGGESHLFVGTGVSGKSEGLHVPVARERAAAVRATLLVGTAGLRRKADGVTPPGVLEQSEDLQSTSDDRSSGT